MVTVIVAVYAKNTSDFKPIVGVFKNGLENEPEAIHQLSLDRDGDEAEKQIAGAINAMLNGCLQGQHYTIEFFEGTKVVRTKEKMVIFEKPGVYFSFDILLTKLEL